MDPMIALGVAFRTATSAAMVREILAIARDAWIGRGPRGDLIDALSGSGDGDGSGYGYGDGSAVIVNLWPWSVAA